MKYLFRVGPAQLIEVHVDMRLKKVFFYLESPIFSTKNKVVFQKYKGLHRNKDSLRGLIAVPSEIFFSYSAPEG
jgi:hypothetical protein